MRNRQDTSHKPLVSVVLPVYNVKEYLETCYNSVISQDYENIEIILVDDGSTDGSGELCDALASNRQETRVIHQENGGLSCARNAGLAVSSGDYITFVDSDDWLEPTMISALMEGMLRTGAQVSVTGFVNRYENGTSKRISRTGAPEVLSQTEALSSYLFNDHLGVCVWGKIWKTSLWNDIRCPEGKLFEDQFTTYRLLLNCETVYFDPEPRYNYRQRSGSIGHSDAGDKTYTLYLGAIEQYDTISKIHPAIKHDIAVGSLFWRVVYINYLIKAERDDEASRKDIQRFGRRHFIDIVTCKFCGRIRKAQLLLFVFSWPLYKALYKLIIKNN